jgi:hypothetical protein
MHSIRTADGVEELSMLNSDSEEGCNLPDAPNSQAAVEKFRNTPVLMLKKR